LLISPRPGLTIYRLSKPWASPPSHSRTCRPPQGNRRSLGLAVYLLLLLFWGFWRGAFAESLSHELPPGSPTINKNNLLGAAGCLVASDDLDGLRFGHEVSYL
jgi:hypothetical protein